MGDLSRNREPGGDNRSTLVSIIVESDGWRLDTILAKAFPNLSLNQIQRSIADGDVRVYNQPARKSLRLKIGQVVTMDPAREKVDADPPVLFKEPTIMYEDDFVVVVNKPAGLLVHSAPVNPDAPTVVSWFLRFDEAVFESFPANDPNPGIVHRLDKETSGVLLLARSSEIRDQLAKAFRPEAVPPNAVTKEYVALCDGKPDQERAVIEAPLGRLQSGNRRLGVVSKGRHAETEYETVKVTDKNSLLHVKPYTGRTHQIRIHLAAIGIPVVGDSLYGTSSGSRHLLHSWRLTFPHPDGGQLEVTAPIPDDFLDAAQKMGLGSAASFYTKPDSSREEDKVSQDLNDSLGDLGISQRSLSALEASGISTVGQVMKISDDDLLEIKGFGPKSLEQLRDALVEDDKLLEELSDQ